MMEAIFPETGQNGVFRGGKNDVAEGGVCVPASTRWPGVIEPSQAVGDIIHVTELFNSFARIAGCFDQIPRDRVIDGIDQTAEFLNGDTHSRLDYVHIDKGSALGANVKQQFKRLLPTSPGALAGAEFFDLYKDPREEHPLMAEFLRAWAQFDAIKARGDAQIAMYPHKPVARGESYAGATRLTQ